MSVARLAPLFLAVLATYQSTCRGPAGAGRSRSQAEDAFFARFASDRIKPIDVSDSPSRGPSSAPVTIVEWADFECPHCRHAAPLFEKVVEAHPGKVRLVYKFYPLQAHV